MRETPHRLISSALLVLFGAACGEEVDSAVVSAEPSTGLGSASSEDVPETPFFTPEERATILDWLGPMPSRVPPDLSNAFADDPSAASLGHKLFFEADYSENKDISCSTCHDPRAAFDESRESATSEGVAFTSRSSMSILNGAYGEAAEESSPWQFWDGRADSQWSQALKPPESGVEMGSSRVRVALVIYEKYWEDYRAVFGPFPRLHDDEGAPLAPIEARGGNDAWDQLPLDVQDAYNEVFVNFGKAIAAYERQLVSRNSRFDAFWHELANGADDSDALSDVEKAGLRAFIGKARCLGCHSGSNFTDGQFHNIAVAQVGEHVDPLDTGRADGVFAALSDPFNCAGKWSDHPRKEECAVHELEGRQGEVGAFKTPSLRDISKRSPYMHTGSMQTMEQVIQHYDMGGAAPGHFVGTRDELMRPIGLSSPQRQGLVAFLRALDGQPLSAELLEDPR